MKRRAWGGALFLLAGGCLPGPEATTLVPSSPFVNQACNPAEVRHEVQTPGSKEAAERVWSVGGRVIAANPQIGFRPHFTTIGSPTEEIYHHGIREVVITEGLVRRCEADAQLAAVLCLELGKIIAEREALADPADRQREERGPVEMPVGKYVGPTRRKVEVAPPPSPEALAREYLRKAGFTPAAEK